MKKLLVVLIVLTLSISMCSVASQVRATPSLPDYQPVDWRSGLAGKIDMPQLSTASGDYQTEQETPSSSELTKAYDWYLEALTGNPWLTLRYNSDYVEIWVADDLSFPAGDPRNDDPYNLLITDEMCKWLGDEFNNIIYPNDTNIFGKPFDRDGTNTIFELIGWPSYYYDWIRTSNPQRVILKVLNIQDTNYFYPTYPYYTVGFYDPTYTIDYYNRNMIHVDAWRWWERLGPEGTQWIPEYPEMNVTRPHVYESTVAHEYQHNIHEDWQPYDELFMNEGCSMYAELKCGYGIEANYLNSYFYTPDNSLTVWGDQGDINILADYGAAALWTIYLSDHYGGAPLISYFVQAGVPGIDGINNALAHFKYRTNFLRIYHDWRLANLIRANYPGCSKYNYKSINLNDPSIIPVRTYAISGTPVPWKKGTDFGNTMTILGYDTKVSAIGPFGTDYIKLGNWTRSGIIYFDGDDNAAYGWRYDAAEGCWWSNGENLADLLLVGQASVPAISETSETESPDVEVPPGWGVANLTLVTKYSIEEGWDFGFVQVSTDNGLTWASLSNIYTTSDHDPSAHPDIVANLPGLTGLSPDWPGWTETTMTFDLSAYAGQNVLLGFRYMTDWATLWEGWFIKSASINGVELTLAPAYPYPEADFQVTIVYAYVTHRHTFYVPFDMWLKDKTETGFGYVLLDKPSYVILVVSPTMLQGITDYSFKATSFSFCHGGHWGKWC